MNNKKRENFKLIKFGHRVVSVGIALLAVTNPIVSIGTPIMTTVMAEESKNEWEKPRAEFIEDKEFDELLAKMKADPTYKVVEDSPVKDGDLGTQKEEFKKEIVEVETKRAEYAQEMQTYTEALEKYKNDKISYDEMVHIYTEQKAKYDADVAHNEELKQENERLTNEYNTKKEQYDKDLAAYNQRVEDIKRIKKENSDKEKEYLVKKAEVERRNKEKKRDYEAEVAKREEAVKENTRKINEYNEFLANNPSLIDFSHRGVQLRGSYDDRYACVDKGEHARYKAWWIANNQSAVMGTPDASQMDFHNYGGAEPSKYYKNVFTMYDKETLHNMGYDYSLGDIGITNKTIVNVTYKDSRVVENDDMYGHRYKLTAPGQVVGNFLQFDLHNIGTTESGKTISAHVTVGKWHQTRTSASFVLRKDGNMGAYEDGVKTTYEFYDENTGAPIKLVRMFSISDIEAGENMGVTSNKVESIVPICDRDKARGYTEGTHGYARVEQKGISTAWTFGDEHYANANYDVTTGDSGNNNSTPLAQTIGLFAGSTLSTSWSGAGGGINLNSRNILFKEKPTKITDDSYPVPVTPDYEKTPDKPEYENVPEALPEPTAPEAPKLNTIVEPVEPTKPGEAPTEPTKPADLEISKEIHYHRAYKLKPVTTKWVDEDGKELKNPVTGDKTEEHGEISKYTYVRSDEDEMENVTHVFRQNTTSWIDIDTGKNLKDTVKDVIKEHGDINEYYFVETETDVNNNIIHKFKQIVTEYVDMNGKKISEVEKGKHKEKAIQHYSYRKTEVDKNGNIKHIYEQFNTEFMDDSGNRIAPREEGQQNYKDIPGYEYIRTIPEPDKALVTHIYRQVITSWTDEGGKELRPSDKGIQPYGEIASYTYIRTETKSNGDIVHIFKKAGKEQTGDISLIGFISASILSLFGIKKLKKEEN